MEEYWRTLISFDGEIVLKYQLSESSANIVLLHTKSNCALCVMRLENDLLGHKILLTKKEKKFEFIPKKMLEF